MATISETQFLEMLIEVSGGESKRPEYDALKSAVLKILPEKEHAEGNKHIDNYIKIKLEGIRRNIKSEMGVDVNAELTPFLFPKGMPSGGGRSRADKKQVYGALLGKLGVEVPEENDDE